MNYVFASALLIGGIFAIVLALGPLTVPNPLVPKARSDHLIGRAGVYAFGAMVFGFLAGLLV